MPIDRDAFLARSDSGVLKLQILDDRLPSDGRQHSVAPDGASIVKGRGEAVLTCFDVGNFSCEMEDHAFPLQTFLEHPGVFRIVTRKDAVLRSYNLHLRSQTSERLRHFDPYGTRAEDEQPIGPGLQ